MAMNQFRDSFVGYRQYWVLAQRPALLCRCASAIGFGGNRSIGFYCDTSLCLPFSPKRSILAGLLKFPRRWLRVKRYFALGELK